MATKVGGFTKSGVVQCVKLVEEGTSSKLSSFNGTFSSSNVTCNNGFVITGYKDGTTISTDFDNIRAPLGNIIFMINPTGSSQRALFKIYGDVVNGDVATASLEPELWAGSSAEYLPTNSSDWTSNENFEISQIIIQSTGGSMINQYVPVLNRIHLSFNGQSVMYEKYAGSNPQTYYYNPTDTKFILYAKDRVTYSTVSISKSGVLKCSKLVEEPVMTIPVSDFSGSIDGQGVITFRNGIKMWLETSTGDKIDDPKILGSIQYLNINTQAVVKQICRSTKSGNNGYIGIDDAYYESTEYEITHVYFTVGILSFADTNLKLAIEQSNGIVKRYDSSSQITTSGGTLTYSVGKGVINRTYPISVRIFKDGTIKCSKVVEATTVPVKWGTPTKSPGLAKWTFPNGYVLQVNRNTIGTTYPLTDNYQCTVSFAHQSPSVNLMSFSTSSFTVFDDFYYTDTQINYVGFVNPIVSFTNSYLTLTNPDHRVVGRLSLTNASSNSNIFGIVSSSDLAFNIPASERRSYTW